MAQITATPEVEQKTSIMDLMRQAIEETGTEDRRYGLADSMIDLMSPEEHEFYLREALVRLIPTYDALMRNRALKNVINPPQRVSAKRLAQRDMWQEFLNQSIPVGDGRRKRLGDANAEDLRFAASVRTEQANGLIVEAARYTIMADLIESTGVETLSEIDSVTVQGALTA